MVGGVLFPGYLNGEEYLYFLFYPHSFGKSRNQSVFVVGEALVFFCHQPFPLTDGREEVPKETQCVRSVLCMCAFLRPWA